MNSTCINNKRQQKVFLKAEKQRQREGREIERERERIRIRIRIVYCPNI